MTTDVQPERQGLLDRLRRLPPRRLLESAIRLGLVGPLLLGLLAISGVGHRWIDLLAQFTVPALVVTAGAAVLLGLVRRGRAAAQAALTAVVLLAAAQPQLWPPKGGPEPGAPTLRLYSANLYYLNDDTAAIRASVAGADPDIVLLIELGRGPAGDLDRILEGYPHRVASTRADPTRGPSRSVIASRYPLTAIADRADGLHSVAATVRTPLGPVNVIGVHLTRPWPYQPQWGQISQTMALTDIRRDLSGPVIVAGDFNSVSSARIGRQVKRDMGLIPAPGFPGTWPSALPSFLRVTIDQVWRSPELALKSRRLGRPTGSDHRPVVTEFTRAAR